MEPVIILDEVRPGLTERGSVEPGSGSFVPELLQDLAEETFHPLADPRLFALAVAGHIQRPDLVFRDPRRDVRRLELRVRGTPACTACRVAGMPRPSPERRRSSSRRTRGLHRSPGRSVRSESTRCPSATPPRRTAGQTRGGARPRSRNPRRIQPPVGMPNALAARHPAWSAPVWPPLMIFSSMVVGSVMFPMEPGQCLGTTIVNRRESILDSLERVRLASGQMQ